MEKKADVNTVRLLGEEALIDAVQMAVKRANGFGVIPAYRDIQRLRSPGVISRIVD